MAEAAMLERHIMQAQARGMSADERELSRCSTASKNFPDLGLPPRKQTNCYNTVSLSNLLKILSIFLQRGRISRVVLTPI